MATAVSSAQREKLGNDKDSSHMYLLENEAAAVNGGKGLACADMRTNRMLQKRPGSERGHQPQPRRALLALASASHSSD
eukprot:CAMPEP_0183543850 /NCGR_PEP_ID=MMETSP0371-20130417/46930_1 /TAXON_ID=268820 /ORGANISM="Peridinium aciculiferum, Strain PAER-2" /LENGTH=78 /DNA_ID=CAMNT_0025745429 /DNA_START=103 /DNA_END=337 /DNA_ORIENTATION=+